jgi:hypothetical protein
VTGKSKLFGAHASKETAMNPTTWHHPAARMAGRAGGAGMLGAAAAAAVLAVTNTVTGDMAISAS